MGWLAAAFEALQGWLNDLGWNGGQVTGISIPAVLTVVGGIFAWKRTHLWPQLVEHVVRDPGAHAAFAKGTLDRPTVASVTLKPPGWKVSWQVVGAAAWDVQVAVDKGRPTSRVPATIGYVADGSTTPTVSVAPDTAGAVCVRVKYARKRGGRSRKHVVNK